MSGDHNTRSMVLSSSSNNNDKKTSINQLLKSHQLNNCKGGISQQVYHHSHNFSTGGPNGPPSTFYGRTGSVQPPYRQNNNNNSNNNPTSAAIVSRDSMVPGSANKKKLHRTQTPNRSVSKSMQKASTIYVPSTGAGTNLANISTGVSSSAINTATKRYLKKFQNTLSSSGPSNSAVLGEKSLKPTHPNSKNL